jgi:hypothetical protein
MLTYIHMYIHTQAHTLSHGIPYTFDSEDMSDNKEQHVS